LASTSYTFSSFMNGIKADYCASELVRMNGVNAT
jgi:hypothetical protein